MKKIMIDPLKSLATFFLGAALLSGCSLDGDDGEQGPQGEQGVTGPAGQNADLTLDLTILHMNDHHSHIAKDDFDFDVTGLGLVTTIDEGAQLEEVTVNYGGFPMLVSLFNTLEGQAENVLKLHSGDAMTGTLYYSLFKGQADAAMMNQVCFDAFAIGNHEFDFGDSGLANFLNWLNSSACETPALAANIVPGSSSAIATGYIQPYTIVERSGHKIGIIGIDIAGKTVNSSSPDEATEFLDETTTAQQYIDELTAMGINHIVLMTHYQYENDLQLAANLTGVDVIVGGDSHTLLGDSTFSDLGFNPVAEYPAEATNLDGNKVCVVQAWEYAHIMGKLDVSFDENGHVTSCGGHPYLPIEATISYEYADDDDRELSGDDYAKVIAALTNHPEVVVTPTDATTQLMLDGFDAETAVLEQAIIGTVAEDICLERFPGQGRSNLCDVTENYVYGSDISNIVAKAFLTVTPTADIAIQNGGGVRVDVAAGEYSIGDAYTLLPFSNTLVTLEMTGQQIVDVLEDALANTLDNDGSSGSYPYASGLRYSIDASQAQGSRVSNVEINSRVASDWSAIDLAATYTVVTNDFIASGRDGYATFGEVFAAGDFVNTYTEYAQGFINYVESLTGSAQQLQKLPVSEYSTQNYIGRDGCDHGTNNDCAGY